MTITPRPPPSHPTASPRTCTTAVVLGSALVGLLGASTAGAEPTNCSARSGAMSPVVVELYTSEGCDSCPPADRWLSGLVGRADVLPLAFHVDYWDRLGWVDRYASPAHTRRQMSLVASSGGRFAYTPQLIVQGSDWRGWPGALPVPTPSRFDLRLRRDGGRIEANIQPLTGGPSTPLPAQAAAFWAWTENGHQSAVRNGENAGRQLRHDAVVRALEAVPPWPTQHPKILRWTLPAAERPGQAVLVITDAAGQRPLQALVLGCQAGR